MCSNWEHNIFGMYIDVAVIDCYYWKCENVFFFFEYWKCENIIPVKPYIF